MIPVIQFTRLLKESLGIANTAAAQKHVYDIEGIKEAYQSMSQHAIAESCAFLFLFTQDRLEYVSDNFADIMGISPSTDEREVRSTWKRITTQSKLKFMVSVPLLSHEIQKKINDGTESDVCIVVQIRIRDFANNEKVLLVKTFNFVVSNGTLVGAAAIVLDMSLLNPRGGYSCYIFNHTTNSIEYRVPFRKKGTHRYHLTNRELMLMKYVQDGLSEKQIAHEMNIALSTVKNHKQKIFTKLGASSSIDAINILFSDRFLDT